MMIECIVINNISNEILRAMEKMGIGMRRTAHESQSPTGPAHEVEVKKEKRRKVDKASKDDGVKDERPRSESREKVRLESMSRRRVES